MVYLWSAQLIAYNFLQLCRIECDDVLLEVVEVHVGSVVEFRDRWIRLLEHLCPVRDVALVDLLDVLL